MSRRVDPYIDYPDFEDDDHQPATLEDALAELQSANGALPGPTVLYGLSGLVSDDIKAVTPVWQELDGTYRRVLLHTMIDATESNYDLEYSALAEFALSDEHAEVRQAAIELLSDDESLVVMNRFVEMARTDISTQVRSEAVQSLGRFVLRGELGELPGSAMKRVFACVRNLLEAEDEPADVRRRALEAISNASSFEDSFNLNQWIEHAYQSGDEAWRRSAIVAMGRSCDDIWRSHIIQELENDEDTELRLEAIRATAELRISEAVPFLARLLDEAERFEQEAAIVALGEIGGAEALRLLDIAAHTAHDMHDDDMLELIDDALANANLMHGGSVFGDLDIEDF